MERGKKDLEKKKKKKRRVLRLFFELWHRRHLAFHFSSRDTGWEFRNLTVFQGPPLNFPINSRFYCIFIDQCLAKSFENWPIFLEKLPEVSCFFKIFKASRALWQKVSKIGLFSLKNRRKSADFSSSLLKNLNFSSFHGILTKSFWNWPIFQEKIHRKRN